MGSSAEIKRIASKAILYIWGEVKKVESNDEKALTIFRNIISKIGKADEYAELMTSIRGPITKPIMESNNKKSIRVNYEHDFTNEEKLQVAKIASYIADEIYYKVNELKMRDLKKTVAHYHVLKMSLEAIEKTFEIVGVEKEN